MKLALGLLSTVAVIGLSSAGLAADLTPSPDVTSTTNVDWSGFYAGMNAGYGPGLLHLPLWDDVSFAGPFVGGQIGYNFKLGDSGAVIGVETNLDWANETGSTEESGFHYIDTFGWNGAVTAHLGMAVGSFLPYVLGGVAIAENTLTYRYDDPAHETGSTTVGSIGWTAGIGASVRLVSNLSVFSELRYTDYGTQDYSGNSVAGGPGHLTDTSIRGGANINF